MTREQKLEAALRKVIDASTEYLMPVTDVADISAFCNTVLDVVTQQELCETLATPPTSEWNEAIERAASACEELAYTGATTYEMEQDCYVCAKAIRALKRKERT